MESYVWKGGGRGTGVRVRLGMEKASMRLCKTSKKLNKKHVERKDCTEAVERQGYKRRVEGEC